MGNYTLDGSLRINHVSSFSWLLAFRGLVWVVGLPLVYATRYIRVNTDDFDVMTILQEGAMQAVCLFLVAWIVTYSALHF